MAARIAFALSLVLGTVAQYEIATCNRSQSEVEWSFNVHRETPCHMWWNLGTACYGGWSLGPLVSNNTWYNEPDHNEPCGCSVLAYNLMAACTWCESPDFNSNWLAEKVWAKNCDYNSTGVSAFIGNRTFPKWAYVSTRGAKWDLNISRNIALGKLSPKDAFSHAKRIGVGAVAGAVVGAFLGTLLLIGLGCYGRLWLNRQRKREQDEFARPSINELLYQTTTPSVASPAFDTYGDKKNSGPPGSAVSVHSRERDLPPVPQQQVVPMPDADAIALAILRRVGHEPPQYTPPPSHAQARSDSSSIVISPGTAASQPPVSDSEFNPYTLYASTDPTHSHAGSASGRSGKAK